ncbi:MAG: substrate-binding domain-containing protein [Marinilabilia sp.]
MKNIIFLLKTLLLVALMASCNTKPKVGLLMDTLDIDRWEKDKQAFEERITELGGIPMVRVAEGSSPKQLQQAKELLYDKVDVLVVIPVDLHASRDIVREAHDKEVPVISYDRMIRDCDLDYYVSTDNINIGELQAEYLSKLTPQGKYALIGGAQKDYNATLLHLGWMNVLQPLIDKGDIEIVLDKFVDNWEGEESFAIMNEYLSNEDNELDVVIAGNDELAGGVIRALEDHNMVRDVLVAGQDAELEAIRNIVAGFQTISIYKPIEALAQSAADMAMKLAREEGSINTNSTVNNGKKLVPSLLLSSQVVNKDNIDLTVISEGFMKEEDIYEIEQQ